MQNKINLPRAVWIGGAIAASFAAMLLFAGIGVGIGLGVGYVFNVVTTARPVVVGNWEAPGGSKVEFRKDGTGTFEMPAGIIMALNPTAKQMADMGIKNGIQRCPFKWNITQEEKPVLVIDAEEKKVGWGEFMCFGNRSQSHFAREGDTLTITQIQWIGRDTPRLVLRRLK